MTSYKFLYGYRINLTQLESGEWFAEVPKLKGCIVVAEIPQKALELIPELIEGWLSVAKEEGWEIPEPDTIH